MMKRKFHTLASCALAFALVTSALSAPGSLVSEKKAEAATAAEDATTKTPARVAVHDPSIIKALDGTYYIFGSHIAAAKSTDMVNWQTFTNGYTTPDNTLFGDLDQNFAEPFKWAGSHDHDAAQYNIWAPDVYYDADYVNKDGSKGAYLMYVSLTSSSVRSVIVLTVSQNIEGPYEYVDNIVCSGFTKTSSFDTNSTVDKIYTNSPVQKLIADGTIKDGASENWFDNDNYNNSYCPNAIDATILEDKDGKLWMTYGSWSGGIYILEIDKATGRAIYPGVDSKPQDETDTRITDRYFGTRICGGFRKSGEGPFILYDKASDYYYMYVTYEWLEWNGGYNMRLFRSKTPDGPYLDAAGNNAALASNTSSQTNVGIRVMGNYMFPCLPKKITTCGHNSALIDDDGERYLIYHARFGGPAHEVRVHQQFINEQGWPVTAVYENKGDKISPTGYSKDAIVGDYDFINHGTTKQTTDYHTPKNLVLNQDGTVSGAATGKWEMKDGTYYATFTLDDVTYSGVFFEQHTEEAASKKVMTFTAIGTNNMTIWGSKKEPELEAESITIYAGGDKDTQTKLIVNGSSTVPYTMTYKSADTSIATVDSKGVVKAKKAGDVVITGTYQAGSVSKELQVTIYVEKARLKLKKKKTSLKKGKSYTYTVKGYGLKAKPVTWTSSNKKVLIIGKKNGKAKALKTGSTTITAVYKKKFKATCKVKVKK